MLAADAYGVADLAPLLRALPWREWFPHVSAEVSHPLVAHRLLAVTVLSFSNVPGSLQRPLLTVLHSDSDPNVSALARLQLARIASRGSA